MTRRATDNDLKIYKDINVYLDKGYTYREAVHKVADLYGFTVSGVYGMANRAKSALEHAEITKAKAEKQALKDKFLSAEGSQGVKGTTTLFDSDGTVKLQWVKTENGKESWEQRIKVALETVNNVIPREPVETISEVKGERLTLIPVADLHLGLYASASETGVEWNLDKAVEKYQRVYSNLFQNGDKGESCLIANLGDFTHVDNLINRTPKSGVTLDTSGRFSEIISAAVDLAVSLIDLARSTYSHVTVVWGSGNHDEATAIVMQAALTRLYKYDPNVTVVQPTSRFYVHQHSNVALGFTHGDTVKTDQLPLLMATDYPVIWGSTSYRAWHTGHVHHRSLQEFPGCIVESHGSPVAKDAWHHQNGYRSSRQVQSIVYDSQGEIERQIIRL